MGESTAAKAAPDATDELAENSEDVKKRVIKRCKEALTDVGYTINDSEAATLSNTGRSIDETALAMVDEFMQETGRTVATIRDEAEAKVDKPRLKPETSDEYVQSIALTLAELQGFITPPNRNQDEFPPLSIRDVVAVNTFLSKQTIGASIRGRAQNVIADSPTASVLLYDLSATRPAAPTK